MVYVYATAHKMHLDIGWRLSEWDDDDAVNEDWINYRMVCSHGSAVMVTVLVTIGGM
jgi:hypothetical protein